MADVHSRAQRSYNMSRIRSSGNASTELRLIEQLRRAGIIGWRRKARLPGRPDLIFSKRKLAVFVDGCFWHCCPRCQMIPRSNSKYWEMKFAMNRERDKRVNKHLQEKGWFVLRIWEHSLEQPSRVLARLKAILES